MQKGIVIESNIGNSKIYGLDELNKLLMEGWRVVNMSSMGGGGSGNTIWVAAIVIVEKN